jgi:hydrogenase expression/formation protein HypC
MCLAIPGRIVELRRSAGFDDEGAIDFGGVQRRINLAFVPDAVVGDYVLVHAGFAIAPLDQAEAQRLLRDLSALAAPSEAPP